VEFVLVSPLLHHPLLSLPLEEKLTLVTISPTIVTMKLHELRFRLGFGLITRLLTLLKDRYGEPEWGERMGADKNSSQRR
jgi:hypothetical protein